MANSLIQGIDNIGVCVAELARSVQFYRRLGFEVLFESDRGVTVALGPAKLFLFPAQPGDERTVGRHLGLSGNPPGIDHISFLVDDVDALHASLTAHGVDVGSQPADQDWGARAFGLTDPDGNNLYFLRWLLPARRGSARTSAYAGQPAPRSRVVDVKYSEGNRNGGSLCVVAERTLGPGYAVRRLRAAGSCPGPPAGDPVRQGCRPGFTDRVQPADSRIPKLPLRKPCAGR